MSSDREKIIAKIKKCLALATSSNPHEAARALAQAQKLMLANGVSDADVEMSGVMESEKKAASVDALPWDSMLVGVVSRTFGCECLRSSGYRTTGYGLKRQRFANWIFIGMGGASEVAAYAYEVLARQVAKARRDHMAKQPKACKPATRIARGDAFAAGWVQGVAAIVERFAGSQGAKATLAAYMADQFPETKTLALKDRTKGRNVRPDSVDEGYLQGLKAQLHGAVGGAGEVLRIGGAA